MNKLLISVLIFYPVFYANLNIVDRQVANFIANPKVAVTNDSIPISKRKKSFVGDKILEEKIINKIFSLPEVKVKSHYIDSLSNHKSSISIIVISKPNKKHNYYWVQAGYDNEIRFEPYYNFYVYRPGATVYFFDPMTNKIYSIKEWRKRQKYQM